MASVISISGGKGGVGKTNISVNLAIALARQKSRVCLFDADLGLANVNILLGLYPDFDLEDVVLGEKTLQDIIIKDYNGIDIIPGSSGVERLANIDHDDIEHLITSFALLENYDYCIFDTSSGISKSVIAFCLSASEVIIVVTTEPTSLTDAYALLKVLTFNGFSGTAKIIVNQCKSTAIATRTFEKLKEVVQNYLSIDIEPLGIIAQDKKVIDAVHRQEPLLKVSPDAPAAKCIQAIAKRLIENQPADLQPFSIKTFWEKFLDIARSPLRLPDREQPLPRQETAPEAVQPEAPAEDELVLQEAQAEQEPVAFENAAPEPAGQPQPDTFEDTAPEFAEPQPGEATESVEPVEEHAPAATAVELPEAPIDFDVVQFPTLPHILVKLIQACSDEKTSMKDLAAIIENDPSLSTKILRLVNSVHYGFSRKISNFNQALSLLGIDTIRNIGLSASVYQVFDNVRESASFNLRQFWWHSLMCAVLSNLIAKKLSSPLAEEAFLAGLLHDIGKLVLFNNYPERYDAVLQEASSPDLVFQEELRHFGITHCYAGARIVSHWNLQTFIADAIRYHHEPGERITNALPLVKTVYAANLLCSCGPQSREHRIEQARAVLEIDESEAQELLQEAEERVEQIAASLDITIEQPFAADAEGDREAMQSLTRHVRDLSLLHGTLQRFISADDTASMLQAAREGLQVLFDIEHVLFFLHNEQNGVLEAAAPGRDSEQSLFDELTVPCRRETSLISEALLAGSTIDSFSLSQRDPTIIDEQIIGLLGGSGIVCLPMSLSERPIGVVAIGADENKLAVLRERLQVLSMFTCYLSMALDAERTRAAQSREKLEERLAASSAIAKKIAHEVNNPLSIIQNYLKILELNLAEKEFVCDEVPIMREEIDRVSGIINSLSDFSSPPHEDPDAVDVNALLEDVAALTRESFEQQGIRFHFELDSRLPRVTTGKNSLKQIIVNLVQNAAESLAGGGTISLSTKQLNAAGSIAIAVADDGPGLAEVVRDRLFEPYVSTKGNDHAGLGLSIVYSKIKELQGSIACSSEKGQGTEFTITLPVTLAA